MTNRKLEKCNSLLARELGSATGKPAYAWKWSEDLTVRMQRKDRPFEYKANRETGLIHPEPLYESKRMCPLLHNQWVLCRWLETPDESQWVALFGRVIPWPGAGYYAPTNVELPEGMNPWDEHRGRTVSEWVVGTAREQMAKRYQDHLRDGEEILERREKEMDRQRNDMIDDLKLPFANADHIPGQKDTVSLPATKIAA